MPNAQPECNSQATVGIAINRPISGPKPPNRPGTVLRGPPCFRGVAFTAPVAAERPPQRFEPSAKPAGQGRAKFLASRLLPLEIRRPFDKGAPAINDIEDAQGGPEAGHRQRGRPTKLIGLRA